jgi:hypothetical protein
VTSSTIPGGVDIPRFTQVEEFCFFKMYRQSVRTSMASGDLVKFRSFLLVVLYSILFTVRSRVPLVVTWKSTPNRGRRNSFLKTAALLFDQGAHWISAARDPAIREESHAPCALIDASSGDQKRSSCLLLVGQILKPLARAGVNDGGGVRDQTRGGGIGTDLSAGFSLCERIRLSRRSRASPSVNLCCCCCCCCCDGVAKRSRERGYTCQKSKLVLISNRCRNRGFQGTESCGRFSERFRMERGGRGPHGRV